MSDVVVSIDRVSKYYKLYSSPRDRLKEAFNPFGVKYHKDYYALKDISLEINKGEVIGIVGANGSGKSTLLKLIAGVLTPSGGDTSVKGSVSALLELGAGFNPEFTGLENIYFYGSILGYSRQEIGQRLDSILEFADIGEFIDQPLKTYSNGMKARLGFSLAISVDPDILIIDEVLAVGDLSFRTKCYKKINELFNNEKTVILVTHNTQQIAQYCSRAVFLNGGRIVSDGNPKHVITDYERYVYGDADVGEDNTSSIQMHNIGTTIGSQTNKDRGELYSYIIVDSNDDETKILEIGREYRITYKVKFHYAMKDVLVGVQIRDHRGLLISGANLWDYQQEKVPLVEKGAVLSVECAFRCLLKPGDYTVTVTCFPFKDEGGGKSMTIYDAIAFRVQASKAAFGGLVCLDQKLSVNVWSD